MAPGLSVRPLRATFRLAAKPVNDAESFVPAVKVEPLAHANASIPWATDRVSESVLTPAAAWVKLTAWLLPIEETSDRFSLVDSFAGAAIT